MATRPVPEEETAFDLAALKKLYSEARDNTDTSRKVADECLDYYSGKQLSKSQIDVLRKRKQPEIWINRIAPAVNGILGVLEQGQADPRAFPRNEEDQNASEVATDSLRYASDKCRWPRTKLAAAKTYLIGGIGAVIIEVDDDLDPLPRIIRDGEFIYDPHSRDPDFEDARYKGVAKWMYVDAVKAIYPLADIDPTAVSPTNVSFDDEDKPQNVWGDSKRKRVLIVELYINQNGWKRVVFWGGGVLEASVSPYNDERGTPCCPIEAQSALIDRDNARYGIVKDMIPIQDEINMRRSRLLHLSNSRQLMVDPNYNGPDTDADIARVEAARPDGVFPPGFQPVPTTDMAAGQVQLLQESKAELERMGPNPAVLGQSNASASGRAQLVRQQAGLTELTPVLGGIEDFELRVFRQMWARIKQFWNEPKTVRVTDDIGAAKFLMVNEPIIQEVQAIVPGPDGQPTIGTQQVVVEVRNRPAEMDMDIIIDATPDSANLAAEQFAEIMKLVPIYGPVAFPLEMVIKASALPKKRELLEALEAQKEEAAQAAQQGQSVEQQMQEAAFKADLDEKNSKTMLNTAKAEDQAFQTQVAAFQAGASLGAAAG